MKTIEWISDSNKSTLPGHIRLIDQTRLPLKLEYIETDNNRNVPDILVNPNIKLLNTKLTPTWGTYVKDEETGIGYRRKCDYMYTFETIDDAIKWLDETEENVIETLRKIRRENERKMSITYEGSREYVI